MFRQVYKVQQIPACGTLRVRCSYPAFSGYYRVSMHRSVVLGHRYNNEMKYFVVYSYSES